MRLPVLPVFYYHDHFTEMLSFVSRAYEPILTERHRAFIQTFGSLSKDAQCLLIRMINRRGRVFRHSALVYAEISSPQKALVELTNCNLIRPLQEEDYAAFTVCHAKEALIKGGRDAGFADLRTSWPKVKVVEFFLTSISFTTARQYCGGEDFVAL